MNALPDHGEAPKGQPWHTRGPAKVKVREEKGVAQLVLTKSTKDRAKVIGETKCGRPSPRPKLLHRIALTTLVSPSAKDTMMADARPRTNGNALNAIYMSVT